MANLSKITNAIVNTDAGAVLNNTVARGTKAFFNRDKQAITNDLYAFSLACIGLSSIILGVAAL